MIPRPDDTKMFKTLVLIIVKKGKYKITKKQWLCKFTIPTGRNNM